jgi:hypothetical protein
MEELCFLCGPWRDVTSNGQGQLIISSVRVSMKRGIATVGAVTRKRLITG